MTRRDGHPDRYDDPRPEALDGSVFERLREPERAPDLTAAIMGRLRYMRARPGAVRRESRRRIIRRAGALAVLLTAGAAAVLATHTSTSLRAPDSITIPEALGRDLERHQRNFGTLIRTIRDLAPADEHVEPAATPPAVPPANPKLDPEVDRSAMAHVQWV